LEVVLVFDLPHEKEKGRAGKRMLARWLNG